MAPLSSRPQPAASGAKDRITEEVEATPTNALTTLRGDPGISAHKAHNTHPREATKERASSKTRAVGKSRHSSQTSGTKTMAGSPARSGTTHPKEAKAVAKEAKATKTVKAKAEAQRVAKEAKAAKKVKAVRAEKHKSIETAQPYQQR